MIDSKDLFDLGVKMMKAQAEQAAMNRELDNHSDTYSGDSAPALPDPFSVDEAIACLELHCARAMRNGGGIVVGYDDLRMVADVLRGIEK